MIHSKAIHFDTKPKSPAPTSDDERSLAHVAAALRKAGLEQNAQAIERAMAKAKGPARR